MREKERDVGGVVCEKKKKDSLSLFLFSLSFSFFRERARGTCVFFLKLKNQCAVGWDNGKCGGVKFCFKFFVVG